MSNTRQIGGIEVFKTVNTTRYECRYYVPEAELALYMPEIGDSASWGETGAVVTAVSKTWLAPGAWLLQITAEAGDMDSGGHFNYKNSTLDRFVEKDFSLADIYFPHEWWGIRVATADDTPPFNIDNKLEPGQTKYFNIEGIWAVIGDYIYCNTVPQIYDENGNTISNEIPGTPDYSRSPFINPSSIPLKLIGQTLKTRLYRCSFNTRREPHKISLFKGISGSFGNSCSPGTADGRWKAISQYVRRIRSSEGTVYTNVTRSMLEAPENLKWDPDKNGGVWTW